MKADDLARLDLAKRAFRSTEPTEREVQIGVRRARLALERRKPRRNWFSKGLVMVVLAAGGLAYAKPQAVGDIITRVTDAATKGRAGAGAGRAVAGVVDAEQTEISRSERRERPRPSVETAPSIDAAQSTETAPSIDAAPRIETATAGADARVAMAEAPTPPSVEAAPRIEGAQSASREPKSDHARSSKAAFVATEGSVAGATDAMGSATQPTTEWGRVGQALAQGDERQALRALNELSDSEDPRTRDKADLGRAQLLMARGNAEKACAIARSLTHRRAGSRIERQAQVLLKSCR